MANTVKSVASPIHPDLQAMQDAVGALTTYLFTIVNELHMAIARDRQPPASHNYLKVVAKIEQLRADAESKLATVGSADVKLGVVYDDVLDLLELAASVRNTVHSQSSKGSPDGLNETINQFADLGLKVGRFLGGHRSGIDHEIRVISRRWMRKMAQGKRSPGRPRVDQKVRAGMRARELKNTAMSWKEVTRQVNRELGAEYKQDTLKRYARLTSPQKR